MVPQSIKLGVFEAGLFHQALSQGPREAARKHRGLPGIPNGLRLSRIAQERSGDADFVEQMRLDVYLHRFTRLAEIVINAVRAPVPNALDGHGSAAVARNTPMNVPISPGLVLRNMIQQVEQVLALSRRRRTIIPIPPGEHTLIIHHSISTIQILHRRRDIRKSRRRQRHPLPILLPMPQLIPVVVILIELHQRALDPSARNPTPLQLLRQVIPLRTAFQQQMRGWEIQREKRLQKRILHHLAHSLCMGLRNTHFLHQLVSCRQQ